MFSRVGKTRFPAFSPRYGGEENNRESEAHRAITPGRVRDLDSPASELSPKQIAQAYVRSIAPRLALGESTLHFDRVKKSILGSHVLFQQFRDELPVSGAWLRIDISPDGRVFNVLNDLIPQPAVTRAPKEKTIGAREADRRAREAVEAGTVRVVEHERVFYPVNGKPKPCWKVIVRTRKPMARGRSTSTRTAARWWRGAISRNTSSDTEESSIPIPSAPSTTRR